MRCPFSNLLLLLVITTTASDAAFPVDLSGRCVSSPTSGPCAATWLGALLIRLRVRSWARTFAKALRMRDQAVYCSFLSVCSVHDDQLTHYSAVFENATYTSVEAAAFIAQLQLLTSVVSQPCAEAASQLLCLQVRSLPAPLRPRPGLISVPCIIILDCLSFSFMWSASELISLIAGLSAL